MPTELTIIKTVFRKAEKEVLFTGINLLDEDKIKVLEIENKNNFTWYQDSDLAVYKYINNGDLVTFCQIIIDYCQESKITLDLDKTIEEIINENQRKKENYTYLINLASTIKTFQNINKSKKNNDWENQLMKLIEEKHQEVSNDYLNLIDKFNQVFQEKIKTDIVLYNKQKINIFYHLVLPSSCNFSVPGSGKTLIGLLLFFFYEKIKNIQKLLLVAPLSSYMSWQDEYCKFFKNSNKENFLEINTIPKKNREASMGVPDYQFLLINYENLDNNQELLIKFLRNNDVFLIFDEAHKIKNYGSKRTEAAIKIAKHCQNKLILTGTPMPKGYEDLKNYFDIIYNPLAKGKIIKKETKTLIEMSKYPDTHSLQIKELEKAIENYYFRINKKELNLKPAKTRQWENFQNDREHQDIYKIIERRLINELKKPREKIQLDEILKARIYRLMQVSIDPRMVINAKKIWEKLNEQTFDQDQTYNDDEEVNKEKKIYQILIDANIDEKEKDSKFNYQKTPQRYYFCLKKVKELFQVKKIKKIIIWSCWIFVIEKLKELFAKNYSTATIYGSTSHEDREKYFHDFQKKDGKIEILICNPASVSESVSLHEYCHNAIYFDMTWNALYYLQSKDRIHRYQTKIQEKEVNYYILIRQDSIDKRIWNNIWKKEKIMLSTIEGKKLTPTKEKTDTLLEEIHNYYKKQLIKKK